MTKIYNGISDTVLVVDQIPSFHYWQSLKQLCSEWKWAQLSALRSEYTSIWAGELCNLGPSVTADSCIIDQSTSELWGDSTSGSTLCSSWQALVQRCPCIVPSSLWCVPLHCDIPHMLNQALSLLRAVTGEEGERSNENNSQTLPENIEKMAKLPYLYEHHAPLLFIRTAQQEPYPSMNKPYITKGH